MTAETPKVYKAISDVQAKLAEVGIAKLGKNRDQNYAFRGIDQVYDALSPILAKNSLSIIPRVLDRVVTERATRSGSIMFNVAVRVEFDLCCSIDGSRHVACTWGEASDSADKATNKAMSAAYKYMAFQLFCIPLDAMDADETTPEPVYKNPPLDTKQPAAKASKPQQEVEGKKPAGSDMDAAKKAIGRRVSVRTEPFSSEELENLENDICVAIANSNDAKLYALTVDLGVERNWIGPKLKNLVVMCFDGRIHTMKVDQLKGYEAMLDGFERAGVLSAVEVKGFKNNARSVFNVDLVK